MNDIPRRTLIALIAKDENGLLTDSRKLSGLLLDLCPAYRKEIRAIMTGLEEHIPEELLKSKNEPPELYIPRLTQRLLDATPMTPEAACWIIETWALALRFIKLEDLTRAETGKNTIPQINPRNPPSIQPLPDPLTGGSAKDIGRDESLRVQGDHLFLCLSPQVEMELCRIPASEFWIGSDPLKDGLAWGEEQQLQHKLNLREYWLGRYPVTVEQYRVFAETTGYSSTAEMEGSAFGWTGSRWDVISSANWKHPRGEYSDVSRKGNHPVTAVSWDDAMAFSRWLHGLVGNALLKWQQVRLPTEAEWEKAGRGVDGRFYPWGKEKPDSTLCNYNRNVRDTTPVGKYSPVGDSPYGCADMAGNVWEWTHSLLKGYPYQDKDGREDVKCRDKRVLRGGSFDNIERRVHCAFRNSNSPILRDFSLGFRVGLFPILYL